ncbi:restriction endonuclease EcoRV [Salinisphaera sp. S4-8]|uniref:type II restriction endonuclease n=1 Tax=Salinisphaera sp. S4-8 TaxID=633357 RepID=UPI0033425BBF
MSTKDKFDELMERYDKDQDLCGVISSGKNVYPLGSDTKVLSTIFELFSRPLVKHFADKYGYEVIEPDKQNHYPDFTLQRNACDRAKIAIDVKTTYVIAPTDRFSYTLGGYTSFIRNNTKNIVFPFNHYSEHWVLGYVYTRSALKKSATHKVYKLDEIDEIPRPYQDVEWFFQEKWRIAGDKAGSGNTTNIGSIYGCLEDFQAGNGPFRSEDEFLDYWRHYERTAEERARKFSHVEGYRQWLKS